MIWAEGFGWANFEHLVAVRPETGFRVGSIFKVLTPAAWGCWDKEGS